MSLCTYFSKILTNIVVVMIVVGWEAVIVVGGEEFVVTAGVIMKLSSYASN